MADGGVNMVETDEEEILSEEKMHQIDVKCVLAEKPFQER